MWGDSGPGLRRGRSGHRRSRRGSIHATDAAEGDDGTGRPLRPIISERATKSRQDRAHGHLGQGPRAPVTDLKVAFVDGTPVARINTRSRLAVEVDFGIGVRACTRSTRRAIVTTPVGVVLPQMTGNVHASHDAAPRLQAS